MRIYYGHAEKHPNIMTNEHTFKRGKVKGPGRPKGMPNKNTAEIKEMILTALNEAGGAKYLQACAMDPKLAPSFLTLVGKVLPMQITGADGGTILQDLTVRFVGQMP